MIDANQRWDVQEAIDRVSALAEFRPLWVSEISQFSLEKFTTVTLNFRLKSPPKTMISLAMLK